MAKRIIPGLPQEIRIATLGQTASDNSPHPEFYDSIDKVSKDESQIHTDRTVLQQVIESDQSRNAILHDMNGQPSQVNSLRVQIAKADIDSNGLLQCCQAGKMKVGMYGDSFDDTVNCDMID